MRTLVVLAGLLSAPAALAQFAAPPISGVATPVMNGITGSIGGGLLAIGSCASGTAAMSGVTTGMVVFATPLTYPGDGVQWQAYVSAPNVVTVKACGLILVTPVSTPYAVRAIP